MIMSGGTCGSGISGSFGISIPKQEIMREISETGGKNE